MTVIRPNSISGVTSITALANEINVFKHDGVLAGLQLNGVNHHTSSGVSTFHTLNVLGNVSVGGTLTYQDVTNIDSVGVITARNGINISSGSLTIPDSIIHSGDTNTKIRFPANDSISFETGGTQRAVFGSDGKFKHESTGAVAAEYTTSNGSGAYHKYELGSSGTVIGYTGSGGQLVTGSGADDFAIRSQANLVFSSGGSTERLRIDSSGNMGLGGAPIAPGHLTFHINNSTSSAATRFHMTTNGTGATASDGFSLSIDGSSSDVNLIQRESANMLFYTAGTERLRIDGNGKVIVASGQLHSSRVLAKFGIDCQGLNIYDGVGVVANYGMAFYNDPTTDKANGIGFFNDDGQTCGGYIVHQDKGSGNLGDIVMATSATSNNPVERLRIKSDGHTVINEGLGVGGQDPGGSTLRVHGSIYASLGGNTAWQKLQLEGSNNTAGDAFSINNWGDVEGDYWMIGVNQTMNQSGNYSKTNSGKRSAFVTVDGRMGRIYLGGSSTSGNPTEHFYTDWSGSVHYNSGYGSLGQVFGCRAWCQNNGTSAVQGSGNISSVTDNGTGDYTFNFSTNMPDNDFSATATAYQSYNTIETSWMVRDWGNSFVRLRRGYVYTSPGSNDGAMFLTVHR